MSHLEALQIIGGLFGCWIAGYSAGFIIKFIKQLSEKI